MPLKMEQVCGLDPDPIPMPHGFLGFGDDTWMDQDYHGKYLPPYGSWARVPAVLCRVPVILCIRVPTILQSVPATLQRVPTILRRVPALILELGFGIFDLGFGLNTTAIFPSEWY